MQTVDATTLVRRYLDEVVNTGDVSRIEGFLSPDHREVHDGRVYPIGVAGAREHVLGVRRTYPDLQVSVERQIAEGEWVATVITARGTHAGEWAGIRPTGKVLTYTGVNVDRVVDGRIVEHGGAANLLGPLLEAGAVRAG
jgi:predicted ester cyclase